MGGRAARRAQERAERRQRQVASAPRRPQISVPASAAEGARRGSLLKPRWATDIISELRKVTWPTRQDTASLTLVVVVVSLLFGAVLGASDIGFSWLIEHTILR
ncbi:MAG: preprotein translocase subunit SecE [Dehalococcoidia bacterium]|nr:preprotein translocase subunit SecE [Dehalococcoidia bacterium]